MPRKWPKQLIVLLLIVTTVISINLFFVSPAPPYQQNTALTDVTTCRTCHQAVTDSFIRTAHYFDSRPADSSSIKGSFAEGKNTFRYNPFMEVHMVKDGSTYWQSGQVNGMETVAAPFDVVIGSGRNGQTYFTWSGNQLLQLPVSYYAPSRQWCNSPGFPNYFFFGRQVRPNCMECHTTYTKVLSHEKLEYDRSSIVYGITCERCHPGAEEHVVFHTANPEEKKARHILNTAHLNRQLRMDACGLCHSGFRTQLKPVFSFKAGDSLDKYSIGGPVSTMADTLDVHGNQNGLLMASKCYIRSVDMDCSTCHNVHNNEFGNTKLFSSKCMSCHSNGNEHMSCTMSTKKNIVLSDHCVDCHMPVRASEAIQLTVNSAEQKLPDYLHTHYISIYKDAAEDFLKKR